VLAMGLLKGLDTEEQSTMYKERVNAASSGAETTFELIDSPSANHPQIPKTPIELLAAITPTDPKFDLADFACRSGFLAAALEHVNDCICSAVVWMPVDGEDNAAPTIPGRGGHGWP
jgi:hypothetical protein